MKCDTIFSPISLLYLTKIGMMSYELQKKPRMKPNFPIVPTGVWNLIGNTPILPLHFAEEGVTIDAKCEFLNPF